MTEGTLIFKILGGLLILVGVILASNPELVSNKPVPEDIFKAVERRVWWGLFISAGILVMFHHPLQPWIVTFVATSIAITFGLLAARLIGIMLDGSVPKQWFWVIVEAIALGGLAWWYAEVRT